MNENRAVALHSDAPLSGDVTLIALTKLLCLNALFTDLVDKILRRCQSKWREWQI